MTPFENDAYDLLFKSGLEMTPENFLKRGIDGIIQANTAALEHQWEVLKADIIAQKPFVIRGYGRDGKNTIYFKKLYRELFDIAENYVFQSKTGNSQPTALIQNLTGLQKNRVGGLYNYQVAHLFGKTKNPFLFTAGWNIAFVPKFLDPFTGHETKGEYERVFKESFQTHFKHKLLPFIRDYNNLMRTYHKPLEVALNAVILEEKLTDKLANQFRKDAREQFAEIPLL